MSTKMKTKTKNSNEVVSTARAATSAYFEMSGIRRETKLSHNPFLVFNKDGARTTVEIVDSAKDLLTYPTQTKVMAQWAGKQRSDFFQFTVGQLKKHIKENPPRSCEEI